MAVLSGRFLDEVADVNHFVGVLPLVVQTGLNQSLYFQLVDLTQSGNSNPMRYMPSAGATLSFTVWSIDDNLQITRMATQPFSQDPSIWQLPLLNTDPLQAGTPVFRFILTEGVQVTQFLTQNKVRVSGSQIQQGSADTSTNF